jgi:gamma-glutamyltranspeptidase/glutathione hydrolase
MAVIDRFGNMVSMTQTLGNFYGCEIIEPGFKIIYNNLLQGTCKPTPGELIASEMSPTIVLRDGKPLLAVGSAGSSRIPYIIAQVISNVVDRGMTIEDAMTAPRVLESRRRSSVEVYPPIRMRDVKALQKTGYDNLRAVRLPTRQGRLINCGGVSAAYYDAATGLMTGVGDPRRSGRAAGAEH